MCISSDYRLNHYILKLQMINKEDRDEEAKHKREKEAGERANSGQKARRRKEEEYPLYRLRNL